MESLHVGRKGKEPGEPYGEAFPLTNWNSAAIIDLLRTLPVEGAAETNRLWTRPDVEYRLGFTNALTYRVQVQGNQLRVWASDMPQVLQFTVPQKEVDDRDGQPHHLREGEHREAKSGDRKAGHLSLPRAGNEGQRAAYL